MRLLKRVWVEITSFFETDELREEEINLKNLSIIFFLGLLLLFGTYFLFFDESRTVYNLPTNAYEWIKLSIQNIYDWVKLSIQNIYGWVKLSIQNSAISKTKTIDDSYKILGCKNCKINIKQETGQNEETWVVDYELSHKGYLWRQIHKVFERIFDIPVDFGWIQINKELNNVDGSQYNSISLLIKGTGKPSNLEFSIVEEDGDVWYYFDKNSLLSKEWIEIKMSFKDFVNPEWAGYGDGKKEFKNVTDIRLTVTNFDKPIKNVLYFKTFNGELFKLI